MRESDLPRRLENAKPVVPFWFLVISCVRGWARAHQTACRHVSFVLAAVATVTTAASLGAQQPPAGDRTAIEVLPVQKNVYMLAGAGGNITVQIGSEGVLLVDTALAASAAPVMAAIRQLSKGPIRVIINTHVHPDHVGGNAAFAAQPPDPLQPLNIIAHENVLGRLARPVTGKETPALIPGLPRSEYFTPTKDLHFNGEAIVLYHEPKAHTDGDMPQYRLCVVTGALSRKARLVVFRFDTEKQRWIDDHTGRTLAPGISIVQAAIVSLG